MYWVHAGPIRLPWYWLINIYIRSQKLIPSQLFGTLKDVFKVSKWIMISYWPCLAVCQCDWNTARQCHLIWSQIDTYCPWVVWRILSLEQQRGSSHSSQNQKTNLPWKKCCLSLRKPVSHHMIICTLPAHRTAPFVHLCLLQCRSHINNKICNCDFFQEMDHILSGNAKLLEIPGKAVLLLMLSGWGGVSQMIIVSSNVTTSQGRPTQISIC